MTQLNEAAVAPRILPDLTGSAATASVTDTEAMIKSIISQVQMKTAEFVQAVIAEAGIEKAASVKTVKQLIAKWAKAGHKPTALVPTCKFVAQDLPPKPDKPKGTKKTATPKEKAPAKPCTKKYKAPPKFQLFAVPLMVAKSIKVSHSDLAKADVSARAQAYTEMRMAA